MILFSEVRPRSPNFLRFSDLHRISTHGNFGAWLLGHTSGLSPFALLQPSVPMSNMVHTRRKCRRFLVAIPGPTSRFNLRLMPLSMHRQIAASATAARTSKYKRPTVNATGSPMKATSGSVEIVRIGYSLRLHRRGQTHLTHTSS